MKQSNSLLSTLKVSIALVAAGIVVLLIFYFSSFTYHKDRCRAIVREQFLPRAYSGVVVRKFMATTKEVSPVLVLNDSEQVNLMYYPGECYDYIQPHDSLLKLKSSLPIRVYRNNQVKVFYPLCVDEVVYM